MVSGPGRTARKEPVSTASNVLCRSYCYPEPDQIREGVRRLARVIEAELDLHSTFDAVDTGTFRAVRPGADGRFAGSGTIVGPANSNAYEDGR